MALLNRRAAGAGGWAVKEQRGVPPTRGPGHRRLKAAQRRPLLNASVAPIWREIMSACRR